MKIDIDKKGVAVLEGGALRAKYANAKYPMQQMIVHVYGDLDFYVHESWDNALICSNSVRSTVDLQRAMTREEWEEEAGGLCDFDTLAKLVDKALSSEATTRVEASL